MKFATFALAASLLGVTPVLAGANAPPPPPAKPDLSGLHAFDFIAGKWRVHNRVLKERLAGSHDWIEYDGTQTDWLVLDGYGNVDDNVFYKPGGTFRGVTLRAYDPRTGLWAIWWLDGRDPFGNLDPPVKGRFVNGVGTFYNDDTLRGKPIRVRYVWTRPTPDTRHWEQAFSPDGGKTWETNWVTDFTRVPAKPAP
ncbi:MAG: DUF1579 domain-containing protein [Rhizomicrobium sp.]